MKILFYFDDKVLYASEYILIKKARYLIYIKF